MAQSFVQLAADSTGKKIDTQTTTTAAQHRQVMVIGAKDTDANVAPVDATKGLAVDLTATGANSTALKVDGSAVTQPVSATSLPLPAGAATVAKQPALGVAGTASADVLSVQGIASMTALKVDGSGVTQPVSVASLPALATGANTIGAVTQASGPWTTIPTVAATSQGLTIYSNAALSNTVVAVKASAGRWHKYYVYNPNASVAYLQCFNKATGSVTLGVTAPDEVYAIPANGYWDGYWEASSAWSTALSIAVTTTATGSTALTSALLVNLGYI